MQIKVGDKFRWLKSSNSHYNYREVYEVVQVESNLVYIKSKQNYIVFYNWNMTKNDSDWEKVEKKKSIKRNLPPWF